MSQHTLYLASASPRRRQLLRDAGITFIQHVVPVDEDALTDAYTGPMGRLGEYLARRKAVAAQHDLRQHGRDGFVLASDTTVLFSGRSLPKPADAAEAIGMLRALRHREHVVATGVALALPDDGGAIRSATSLTRVRMRDYSDQEIQDYVESGDPFDKAGAYSIQHSDFHPVASFSGCYLGVVGLPVCIVAALLGRAVPPPNAATNCITGDQRCIWSPRCAPPYPTAGTLEANDDEHLDA